jgi:TatA/E family protein of Tat protein translocase
MPFNIGPGELIIVLIIALVVLGPGRLPDVAQSLGKSLREFRRAATDISDSTSLESKPASPTANSQPTAPAAPPAPANQAQPNTLSGEAPPNTLEGSSASPVATDGETTPPAA